MPEPIAIENLMFYDPDLESYAAAFRAEHGSRGKTHSVATTTDLIDAVKQYSKVRYLEVVMHGSPGMIWFKTGGQMVARYLGVIINDSKMLSTNARILFLGCNIADGPAGDTFLVEIGKAMFPGTGGTVGGTNSINVVIGGTTTRMNPLRFFDTKLKVRRFDADGKMIAGEDVGYWGDRTTVNVR